jgi:ribonuclease HI
MSKFKKNKIIRVGQPCRHCETSVEMRIPKHNKFEKNQWYYFEWYLKCPNCNAMYMVEEAKRIIPRQVRTLL